jgi:hypothetical protein
MCVMTKRKPLGTEPPAGWPRDNLVPVDPATLTPAMRAELARRLAEDERRTQRAAVLDAKLRALIGPAAADALDARGLVADWDEPQLRALEDLVAAVEHARAEAVWATRQLTDMVDGALRRQKAARKRSWRQSPAAGPTKRGKSE